MAFDNRVVGREGFKLVLSSDEWVARRGGDVLGHEDVVALGGVDARAHRRAAQGELLQVRKRVAQGLQAKLQLRHVPAKLLAQSQWGRIHKVGATDFDNVVKGLGLRCEGVTQTLHARKRGFDDGRIGRDVHCRGVRVVGALALVHIVVGMHWTLALTKGAACQDMGAVGHHFVDVHVALSS